MVEKMYGVDLNVLANVLNLSKMKKDDVRSEPHSDVLTLSRLKEINHADKEIADDLMFTSPQHATVIPLLRALWIDEGSKDMQISTADGTVIKCHRSIFKMVSKFTSDLLFDCQEVDDVINLYLPDFPFSSVERFLKALYCITRVGVHSDDIEIQRLAECLEIDFSYPAIVKDESEKKPVFQRLIRNPMTFNDYNIMPSAGEYCTSLNEVKVDFINKSTIETKLTHDVEVHEDKQSDDGETSTMTLDETRTFKCKMCDKTFHHSRALRRHQRHVHDDFKLSLEERVRRKEDSTDVNSYTCTTCDKTFTKKTRLREHERNHNKNVCTTCGKSFARKSYLRQHELSHTEGKPFSCTRCDNKFTTKNYLNIHEKAQHDGQRSFLCTQCDKMFVQLGDLKKHELVHSGVRPFECKVCKKTFVFKQRLQRHELIHTGTKPYSCSIKGCDKRFVQVGHLRRHELLHTDVKPFECKTCGKAFAQNAHLNRHTKIHSVQRPS